MLEKLVFELLGVVDGERRVDGPVHAPQEQFLQADLVVLCLEVLLRAPTHHALKDVDECSSNVLGFQKAALHSELHNFLEVVQA